MTFEQVLTSAAPLGINLARKVFAEDPRFPKPVLDLGKGGRRLYSVGHIEAYFAAIERDGFPHRTETEA
jgi:hypothetical protein